MIERYTKLLNAYNPAHYPANKKITSEEWNALWMSVVHQGNRQEEMLELIINTYLSEQVISINAIDAKASAALSNSESALNAANRAESNSETAVTLAEGADGKSDNAVETANTAAGDAAEALSKANTAISDSSIALNTANAADEKADEAILTAGDAHDIASGIDAKATSALSNSESAVSDASAALSTANAASSNASTALSTANTAAEDARAAVITANSAHDIATGIDAKATSALSNSETAVSDASEALSKANTAISDSSTALSTANTAAGDASEALGKANTAISDSSTALSTANIAASDASSAVTTAGTADAKADSAVETAEEALALIESAIQTGGTQIKNAENITITTSRLLQVSDLVDFPTYFTVETNLISAPLFVNRLDTKVDKVTGSRLITDTEATKLSGIATGAQVNVLESITLNSTPLTVANKDIDLSNKFLELTGTQSVEGKKTFEDIDIDGDLKVTGDIIQHGSSYITEAEHLKIADSLMFLRNGAITGLLPGEFTGMQAVKYDGTNDGQLVFDKDGVARVGDIGSLQPLATREESPSDNGFARWNAAAKRFEAVGLKQTTGQSTTDLMSQKAVTDKLIIKDDQPYSQHSTGVGNGYRLVAKFDYSASPTGDTRKVFRFKVKQGHGNGASYVFWGDYIVGLGSSNQITCSGLFSKSDGTFGKCGYRLDAVNHTIYFYIWTGQYSAYYTSDITSLTAGTTGIVTWYTEAGVTADTVTEGINSYYPIVSGRLAIESQVNAKADKLLMTQYRVPYRTSAGEGEADSNLKVQNASAEANTLARRTSTGALFVADATVEAHAVNKSQLDLKADKTELSVSVWDGTYPAVGVTFASIGGTGTGTEADPYIIDSAQKLAWLSANYRESFAYNKYYKQTKDIDLAGHEWTPINKNSTGTLFRYYYDGGGYTIYNLKITASNAFNGLFGYMSRSSYLKNLTINGGSVSCESSSASQAGAFMAILDSSSGFPSVLDNLHNVSVTVMTFDGAAGGIGGGSYESSIITNCSNSGLVSSVALSSSDIFVGGIIGYFETTTISSCSSFGSVTATGTNSYAALIANGGTVTDCIAEGTLTGTNKDYRGQKLDKTEVETTPTSGSDKLVTSGGIKTALDTKLDKTGLAAALAALGTV